MATGLSSLLETARFCAEQGSERNLPYWNAVGELRRRCEAPVFQAAAEWSRDRNPLVRCLGADVLGQLGYEGLKYPFKEQSLPILCNLLDDSDEHVIAAALSAFSHLGAENNLDEILVHAHHRSEDVRFSLVMALLRIDQPQAIAALIELSQDEDSDVRDWATFGLGSQIDRDSPEIRNALVARLADTDGETRDEALVGLAQRGDARAKPVLIDLLGKHMFGGLIPEVAILLGDAEILALLEALGGHADVDADLLNDTIGKVRQNLAR